MNKKLFTYKKSGVNIDAADSFVNFISSVSSKKKGKKKFSNIGGFAKYMHELMDKKSPIISIPEAHHHIMVDQPLALVASLRALIIDWDHSKPSKAS